MNLDKLFKHLADEHGLLLLESEKREIADCLPNAKPVLGAVICRLSSPTLIKPLDFDCEPLYYKMNGMYGYLMPSGKKVLWFYSDADGGLFYDELEGWSVLNGM